VPVPGGVTAAGATGTAAADPRVPPDLSREAAREAAERELSRPEYHENDPNLLQRAMDTFWDWVGDLLAAAALAAPGGAAGVVAVVVLVAALAAAVWWRFGTPRPAPRTSGALFGTAPRTAAEHRAAAETHAAAARWTPALQERMRAIVRALEERDLLAPRPGRTADEAAAEAGRSLPGRAAALRSAAQVFDAVTYGGRTTGQSEYRELHDLDLLLERTRPVTAGTPGEPLV
jgi:hypothetical protein